MIRKLPERIRPLNSKSQIHNRKFPVPPCLSSYRSGFVNRYSPVRIRPGAPFHHGRDVACVEFVLPGLERSGNVTVQVESNDSSL